MRAPWTEHRLGLMLIAAGALALVLGSALALRPAVAQTGCSFEWFFDARTPAACPSGPAASTEIVMLEFERGTMYWISTERMIYILYRDWQAPYWEAYRDTWQPGTIERDTSIVGPLGLWQQPRRGFGQVWRENPQVRERLGWALYEWETVYTTLFQRADPTDGPIYFTDQRDKAFQLPAGGDGWDKFSWLG